MKGKRKRSPEVAVDLVTFEIVKHKVWQILWEGRETMLRVSGSPVVCEAKECMFALYDAQGNTVSSSAGLLLHVIGCEEMIQRIMEWYSEEPGIYDGDVFIFNDAYYGGAHNPDIACLAPVFHEGKLVSWVGALTHSPEVGAIEPGGMCPSATEAFHEGLRLPGLKLMERGMERKEVWKLIERSVRDPAGLTLDCRARVAGVNVGKRRVLELIDRYGADTIIEIFKRLIEGTEKRARAKLRELPDGTWRSITYMDSDGKKDALMPVCVTVTKKGDGLTIDFTGTSPQLPGPANSFLPGTRGSVFVALCSLLFWEEPWNRGVFAPVELIAPEGTVVNARWPAAINQAPGRPGKCIGNALDLVISKMFVTTEKYYEDQNAAWYGSTVCPTWGGRNQHGRFAVGLMFDNLAAGQGAGATFDGVDAGAFQMTPEVILADVEMQESNHPYIYLTRRIAPDSGGPGKFRGGNGLEIIYMLHNTPEVTLVVFGMGQLATKSPGLYGGYPCGAPRVIIAKETNIQDWLKKGKAPFNAEEIYQLEGDIKEHRPMVPATTLKEGDIFYIYTAGAAGYGDPIDRDPEAVRKDVVNHLTSLEYAKDIYGVILKETSFEVDLQATQEQRKRIRYRRRSEAERFSGGAHENPRVS